MRLLDKNKDTVIFKTDPELKIKLKVAASQNRQTMTEFINSLLTEKLTTNN